jgi:hypothetical protein
LRVTARQSHLRQLAFQFSHTTVKRIFFPEILEILTIPSA